MAQLGRFSATGTSWNLTDWPELLLIRKEVMMLKEESPMPVFLGLLLAICSTGSVWAHESTSSDVCPLTQRETLTDGWFGFEEQLSSRGLAVGLSLTQIYQQNIHGGLSTHRRAGRYAGSYDLELEFDLDTLANLNGGSVYVLAEGSWSEGIDGPAVGSIFGVNDDAGGYRSVDITELYYQQSLLDGAFKVRLGKLNLTGGFECQGCPVAFDGNAWANDETAQFLNGALVNNPTIPFPDNGLGLIVYFQPTDCCYVAAGVADTQADARETGFNTAFNGHDYFFYILEAGLAPQIPSAKGPLQGAYRLGLWYDPQPKDRLAGTGSKQDNVGLYISADQVFWPENDNPDDSQGLAIFARYGLADDKVNEIQYFWSVGAQYQGLIPSRDDDVLGCAVAQGRLSNYAGFSASHETVAEFYYNAQVAPWLSITPSLQYVTNPGGNKVLDDALLVGLRLQMAF